MKLLLASASVVLVSASAHQAAAAAAEPDTDLEVDSGHSEEYRSMKDDQYNEVTAIEAAQAAETQSTYVWRTDSVRDNHLMVTAVALQTELEAASGKVNHAWMLLNMFKYLVGSDPINVRMLWAMNVNADREVAANETGEFSALWNKFHQLEQELKGKLKGFRAAWKLNHPSAPAAVVLQSVSHH